ncbi:MAG: hypothetical protein R2838_04100 [Caldilineaceae bacterium]
MPGAELLVFSAPSPAALAAALDENRRQLGAPARPLRLGRRVRDPAARHDPAGRRGGRRRRPGHVAGLRLRRPA